MTTAASEPIDVRTRDGRRLHAERLGTGGPTVVFESGLGASRNMWGAVVGPVAERTTAVVYDRAGFGRSPRAPGPRDLARLADDLLDVLDHLDAGPYVLVGHSWGGPVVRSAAAARPDVIAGLVLVDQSDERCELFFSKGNQRQLRWAPRLMPLLVRTGMLRAMVGRLAKQLPEPWATGLRTEDVSASAIATQGDELRGSIEDLRRLRDEPLELPDVPVTVISGTRTGFLGRARRGELVAAHRSSAASLPQGRHVEASASSHYVPVTEPLLVVDEVLRLL